MTVVVVFVILVSTLFELLGSQEEKIITIQTEAPMRIKRFRSDFEEAEKEFKVVFIAYFRTLDVRLLWGVYLIIINGTTIKSLILLYSKNCCGLLILN